MNKKKWKWVIRVLIFLFIAIVLFLVLYFTNSLDPLLREAEKEINNSTAITIVGFILMFIYDVLKGWITDSLSNRIFPDKQKYDQGKELENIQKYIEDNDIDVRGVKYCLKDLNRKKLTVEEKKDQINKWYDNYTINSKLKDLLILFVEYTEKAKQRLEKEIKSASNTAYKEALEKLKGFFEKGDAKQIKENYFGFVKQQKKENLALLKQSLSNSILLFDTDGIIELHEELIILEPTPENYFNLGFYLQKLNYFDRALANYQEALKIYRELSDENPRTYLPEVATILNNLAVLQRDKNDFPEALANYQEALKIRRELAQENPRTYLPYVATTLNNLANLQRAKNEFPEALANYQEALKIYRELAEANPRTYLPDVAGTLNNLALLQSDKNEFPEALANYQEALKIRRELAEENPKVYLPDVAMALNNLAILQKAKNEFPEALANYQEALKISRELAQENPQAYNVDLARACLSFAYLRKAQFNATFKPKIKREGQALVLEAKKALQIYSSNHPTVVSFMKLITELETFFSKDH